MIELLFSIIVWCVLGGLLYWLVMQLPLPAPFQNIIRVAVILILILLILGVALGQVPVLRFR